MSENRQVLRLDELIDPFEAKVVVTTAASGTVVDARFDLSGLPRVDAMVVGRPVAAVAKLVERLCGLCPAAHHLAGMRALDALLGFDAVPTRADAVRRLLHHGSALEAHAARFIGVDREAALTLRRCGKAAMTAAGSPGHFPATGVPGGVSGPMVWAGSVDLDAALAAAGSVAETLLAGPANEDGYRGANVALVDGSGALDLMGTVARAVFADGEVLDISPSQWLDAVDEECPGDAAPRPCLAVRGAAGGAYRVGPVAQLRVGEPSTPLAAALRARWLAQGGAAAARAVLAVHSVEAVQELVSAVGAGGVEGLVGEARGERPGTATGWVDGPRGLLAHTYTVDADLSVVSARILTPTVQNEPWLAELLRESVRRGEVEMEASIREADPCLPCTSAPVGAMGLVVEPAGR